MRTTKTNDLPATRPTSRGLFLVRTAIAVGVGLVVIGCGGTDPQSPLGGPGSTPGGSSAASGGNGSGGTSGGSDGGTSCQPNCINAICGDDGCGGSCGDCGGAGGVCSNGQCVARGQCVLSTQTGCSAGQRCVFDFAHQETVCATDITGKACYAGPGTICSVGFYCIQQTCQPGCNANVNVGCATGEGCVDWSTNFEIFPYCARACDPFASGDCTTTMPCGYREVAGTTKWTPVCAADGNASIQYCDANHPCPDTDECIDSTNGFSQCWNACISQPCNAPDRNVCVAANHTYTCECNAGYVDNGMGICIHSTTCTPNPCTLPHETQCSLVEGSAYCACDPGYVPAAGGDGCAPAMN